MAPPSTGSLRFFDWPFWVELQALLRSSSGPFRSAAPLVRFAALFGIISLVGYRWFAVQTAALHCRVSGARVETIVA